MGKKRNKVNCLEGLSHYFRVNDENIGICKYCKYEKEFSYEPVPQKVARRYWEISYEVLKEIELERQEEAYDIF